MVVLVDGIERDPSVLTHILSKLYLLLYNVTLKFSFLMYYFDKADGNELLRD